MTDTSIDRREFLRELGLAGAGVLAVTSPWLKAFADVQHTNRERCRLGIIGPGSRGRLLMGFLTQNPKVDIVALADIYQPSIDKALELVPRAKVYKDYRLLLEDKGVDAVVIAKHLDTGRIFFTGQQRLFDPRYIKAMDMVHQGMFGKVSCIHAFWNRNADWRREVPEPGLEKFINWRLYKESSKGLMTELACHQLQVGTWALGKLPQKVMGHGSISYWRDGREVYDNINCIYTFDDGEMMTWGSDISNKFYGLEEQIMGNLGTIEPEKGKYYFETIDPAPAFLQLLNKWENSVFESMPFAVTSWAPETARKNTGEYLLGKRPKEDGTSLNLAAFVEASITGRQPERIAEEGYYASLLCLLGHEAIEQGTMLEFPKEYMIDYPAYNTNMQTQQ